MRIAVDPAQGAAKGARAVLDPAATMQGRGAYLCREDSGAPSRQCLDGALRRGGIGRALRAPVTFDAKLVESVGR